MFKDFIVKYREFMLLSIGTILIVLSISLLLYDQIVLVKSEVFADIALKKHNELQDKNNENNDIVEENQSVDINTDYIYDETLSDDEVIDNNNNTGDNGNSSGNSSENIVPSSEYIGFLEIKDINLKAGLVSKESRYNKVDKNIQILTVSDYPDVLNGNFILASHSGNSKISYFKHLYKLSLGDKASVYYKDYVYHYKIVDIYYVPKVGSLEIRRDSDKTVMTLITCTKNSSTEQTVYILELYSKTRNEG